MNKWVEDASYIGNHEIDKKFIKEIGFLTYEHKRFVKYSWNDHYVVYSLTTRKNVGLWGGYNGELELLESTQEDLTLSELLTKYSEFNILPNAHLIKRVVNNIKQILHDRRTTKEI